LFDYFLFDFLLFLFDFSFLAILQVSCRHHIPEAEASHFQLQQKFMIRLGFHDSPFLSLQLPQLATIPVASGLLH
jgi:hypothetical protein